jgi:hypothetical protein
MASSFHFAQMRCHHSIAIVGTRGVNFSVNLCTSPAHGKAAFLAFNSASARQCLFILVFIASALFHVILGQGPTTHCIIVSQRGSPFPHVWRSLCPLFVIYTKYDVITNICDRGPEVVQVLLHVWICCETTLATGSARTDLGGRIACCCICLLFLIYSLPIAS